MAENGYKISRSNYSIKRIHEMVSGGTVYERDFMATTNLGGFDSGVIPYSEGNFKMVSREPDRFTRKRKYGNWIANPDGGEMWSMNMINEYGLTSESEIKARPNYGSLLDFVYYGSCVELVKTSLLDIINHFPAFLKFTGKEFSRKIDVDFKYVVENSMGIDLFGKGQYNGEGTDDILRHFSETYESYRIYENGKTDDECCLNSVSVVKAKNVCYGVFDSGHSDLITFTIKKDGQEISIRQYYLEDGSTILLSNVSSVYLAGPRPSLIDDYFYNLNDFESLLLNRESAPKYTANIDFYKETEYGIEYSKKRITLPSNDYGLILDINSDEYDAYVTDLLNLAEFFDEHKSNNLIRMMTHDSIKNLDNAYFKSVYGDDADDYEEGESKFKQYLYLIGRFFDDIKRNIELVRDSKTISYDKNNNLPDYFLSDELNNKGWEICSSVEGIALNEKIKPFGINDADGNPIYSFVMDNEYDDSSVNVAFLRNLMSNSSSILSKKGTRNGIESILGMFGMISKDFDNDNYDYELKESVFVANHKEDYTGPVNEKTDDEGEKYFEDLPIEEYNSMKLSFPTDFGEDDFSLIGLPAKVVYCEICESGECSTIKYAVPWFTNSMEIDGNPYFQMYGGWGKREDGDTGITYDETVKYLNVVSYEDELRSVDPSTLNGNDVYYVVNKGDGRDSNYFILADSEFVSHIDSDDDFVSGWTCVKLYDDNMNPIDSYEAKKVFYLESLIDEYRGNNPHTGYGKYDNGSKYKTIFEQILWNSIENDDFSDAAYECETGELITGITECGFSLEKMTDNSKVWYFEPLSNIGEIIAVEGTDDELKFGYSASEYTFFSAEDTCNDMSTGEETYTPTELCADSIINSKNLEIIFKIKGNDENGFKNYINKSVIPYLYQMIPSTTVLKITFN